MNIHRLIPAIIIMIIRSSQALTLSLQLHHFLVLEMAAGTMEEKNTTVVSELESQLSSLFDGRFQHSSWVEQARQKLKDVLNFQVLVKRFFQIRDCLYIAHNDAVFAGDKFNDVQVGIQKLSSETARLCSESVTLLGEFENACGEAISDINIGYSHLQDGQDELALITFQQLSKKSLEMEEESLKLSKSFSSLSSHVEAVLEKILTLKSIQEVAKKKMDEEMKKLAIRRVHEDDKITEAILMEKKAVEQQRTLEAEEKALTKGTLFEDFIHSMQRISCTFSMFTYAMEFHRQDQVLCTAVVKGRSSDAAAEYNDAHREKIKAIDTRVSLDTEAAKFENGRDTADQAARTLHDAAGWLKELSALMLQTSQFWKQLKSHCHSILDRSNQEVQIVNMVIQKPTADRSQVLQSDGFKRTMLHFCANWLSLQQICTESKRELQITEKRLFEDIKSNPTQEEAKGNLLRAMNNYDSSPSII